MKIALLGYGVEAESAYKYYKKLHPGSEFTSYDDKPEPKNKLPHDVVFIGNHHDFNNIDADIVVRTPAIAPSRISSKGIVTSVTKEFFVQCPAPIIGVTGTKGKGTTCSLISEILKSAGKMVWLVGNIGAPAFDVLDKIKPADIVVYELSSYQLWDLDKSPHVAVVLMIEPEHLEVHEDFDDYLNAKINIALHQQQEDIIIFHPMNPHSQAIVEHSQALTKKKYLSLEGAYILNETVVINEQKICSINEIKLIGAHNLENVCAAVTAAWEFTKNIQAIKKALINTKGLPHRLRFVREVNGVQYYDDSISTTPGSAIAALNTFSQPKLVILGGKSKKAHFGELAQKIASSTIRKVILVGQEANIIEHELRKVDFNNYEHFKEKDMAKLVKRASVLTQSGDVVVLSPACSSLDDFENYIDRGDQFIKAVKEL